SSDLDAAELDNVAFRQAGYCRGQCAHGAAPADAEHVVLGNQLAQQAGGSAPDQRSQVLGIAVTVGDVDDHGLVETKALPHLFRQVDINAQRRANGKTDDAFFDTAREQARDLEAGQLQVGGNLNF